MEYVRQVFKNHATLAFGVGIAFNNSMKQKRHATWGLMALAAAGGLLSGCISGPYGANTSRCTPKHNRIATANAEAMRDIHRGMSDYDVFMVANEPQAREHILLEQGSMAEVWYYRTRTTDCKADTLWSADYTPIIFVNRKVMATERATYEKQILPFIRRVGT